MAKRRVVWTKNAESQLQEILQYFSERNKSEEYSLKLYRLFKDELEKVAINPDIGIKTKLYNIRGLIVKNYILFYEIYKELIMVLNVWDCRQDPNKLNVPK